MGCSKEFYQVCRRNMALTPIEYIYSVRNVKVQRNSRSGLRKSRRWWLSHPRPERSITVALRLCMLTRVILPQMRSAESLR